MSAAVTVDAGTCVGSGWCVNLAGGVFQMGPHGKAVVVDPAGEAPEAIEEAIDSCPVSAISTADDGSNEESAHA